MLTASGGPFRGRTRRASCTTSPSSEALAHPTWDMGPVVTINSATLVNKGLEVIEAHLLFGIPIDRIEVVVHPTSVVHSMVEFVDGSTLAQASPPTMLIPIALGLGWPDRVPGRRPAGRLDQTGDLGVLPARRRGVSRRGTGETGRDAAAAPRPRSTTPRTRCVSRRSGRAGWPSRRSSPTVAAVLARHDVPSTTGSSLTVEDVLAADAWARAEAAPGWQRSSRTKGGPAGEQRLLRARRADLRRRRSWSRSGCTSSAT